MNRTFACVLLLLAGMTGASAQAAAPSPTPPLLKPDDRLKMDLLLVVAHPDDETGVVPYLVQLVDQHKRVAVIYTTHGEAGHNNMGPERAQSLGAVRELELRHALESVGINNVWFLSGRDTPSQNVLESLANWRHGEVQEELIRMVRLTRPDVILTWMPGFFIGENHGDHQAAGVLATEAFDMAGDPVIYPAQLAGPVKVNETLLMDCIRGRQKSFIMFLIPAAVPTSRTPAQPIRRMRFQPRSSSLTGAQLWKLLSTT